MATFTDSWRWKKLPILYCCRQVPCKKSWELSMRQSLIAKKWLNQVCLRERMEKELFHYFLLQWTLVPSAIWREIMCSILLPHYMIWLCNNAKPIIRSTASFQAKGHGFWKSRPLFTIPVCRNWSSTSGRNTWNWLTWWLHCLKLAIFN